MNNVSRCVCGSAFANHDYWIKHVEALPVADWPSHGELLDSSVNVPTRVTRVCKRVGCVNYGINSASYCCRGCAADLTKLTPVQELMREERAQKSFGFRVEYPKIYQQPKPIVEMGEA